MTEVRGELAGGQVRPDAIMDPSIAWPRERIVERDERLLNLYNNLRGEILHADTQNYQVLAVAVAATAALLTAGIGRDRPMDQAVVFGLVYLVTWPCQRLLQGNRRRIWRISTYLRTVIEPQLDGVTWESDIALLRRAMTAADYRRVSSMVPRSERLIITVLNTTAGLGLLVIPIYEANISMWQRGAEAVAVIGLNIALAVIAYREDQGLRRGGRIDRMFGELWQAERRHPDQTPADATGATAGVEIRGAIPETTDPATKAAP